MSLKILWQTTTVRKKKVEVQEDNLEDQLKPIVLQVSTARIKAGGKNCLATSLTAK